MYVELCTAYLGEYRSVVGRVITLVDGGKGNPRVSPRTTPEKVLELISKQTKNRRRVRGLPRGFNKIPIFV